MKDEKRIIMKIELHVGFMKLENCPDLTNEEIEQLKEETVDIATGDTEDEYNFLDENKDVICRITVDGDETSLEELDLDSSSYE